MSLKILLVEPAYKTKYPPLGLMKISTYHKNCGDEVRFVKDIKRTPQLGFFTNQQECAPDLIYITSLFTYHIDKVIESVKHYQFVYPNAEIKVGGIAASLMPEQIKQATGITPHVGLLDYAEKCPPDYSLPPATDYSMTFTSRGCPNKCGFCAVRKHEPEYITCPNWLKDIDYSKPKIRFLDNNWLASPNFSDDIQLILDLPIEKLGKQINGTRRYVDFCQGLDCRLLNEEKANLLSQIKLFPIRFAYDNYSHEGYIQNAIKLTRNCIYKHTTVYVLYNTDYDYDTPEYFYYRINEMNILGVRSFPMCYSPTDTTVKCHTGRQWDKQLLKWLKVLLVKQYGIIRPEREPFLETFGKNKEEFLSKLDS